MNHEIPQSSNKAGPSRPIGYSEKAFGARVLGAPQASVEPDDAPSAKESGIVVPERDGQNDRAGPSVIGNPEVGIPDLDSARNPIEHREKPND